MKVFAALAAAAMLLVVVMYMDYGGGAGTTCRWSSWSQRFEWWDDLGPTGLPCVNP